MPVPSSDVLAYSSITGLDLLALLLLLHVWLVGVGLAAYSERSGLPWSQRIDLGIRQYALLALLATVVAWLPFALGDTYPIALGGARSERRLAIVLLIGSFAAVWAGFYYAGGAVTSLRSYAAVRRTPVVDAAAVETGRVQVSGTVRTSTDSREAPLSGRDAVCYDLTVARDLVEDESTSDGDGVDTGGSTGLLSSAFRETIPVDDVRTTFVLEDETGRIAVDPTDAALRLETETTAVVPNGDRPSGSLLRYLVRETEYEATERRERYRETRIEPGDELSVIGVARPDSSTESIDTAELISRGESRDSSERDAESGPTSKANSRLTSLPTITASDSFGEFVVASGCERSVDRQFRRTIAGCTLAAVALTGTGISLLWLLAGHG
ncbi:GIDE domain-containing protein [Natronorubrum texcoconense]|uniref:E3 Ubiquitin ligase n=1 Tax=Natronorubrum texcoconense TaxID=1095776 RepID=A0A1G9ECM6_9EURY|nr:GIDE domain-containing protein [Natronorubrum texcoconense]SDK73818.1 E3 Ubiquitin ligase [Natronorubrum texcoconense]